MTNLCLDCLTPLSTNKARYCNPCSVKYRPQTFQKGIRSSPKFEFQKGQIPWNKGLKGFRKGHVGFWKGKKHSKETRQKMSQSRTKEQYRILGLKGLTAQQNCKKPTSIEKIVYDELKDRGILFEKQKIINGRFVVDAYIPDLNLVIECDGNYWHNLERVQKKDKAENAYFEKCGFGLLRLTEAEIKDGSFKKRLN